MRLIDADELKARIPTIEDEYKYVHKLIDNAPTVKPCDNCDLYFIAKTKEEMRKGGADNGGVTPV